MKKIGILGSGVVGQTLGSGFIKHGYQVMIGTRDIGKMMEWVTAEGEHAHSGSFGETASWGDLIVLACKGTAVEAVLKQAGKKNLAGKTIIDATNPIADSPPKEGVLQFFTEQNDSLLAQNQKQYPDAHFVKAFNTVSYLRMVNPDFESRPTMIICGDNQEAKDEVSQILDQFGWEAKDFGLSESACAVEALCQLICIPGFRANQWTHAFKLME